MLAVDVGGTKLDVGLVDASGQILVRERAPTDGEEPWPGVAALVEVVLEAGRAAGIEPLSCGVGCGGPMERGGTAVSPLNIPGWRSFPLLDRITALTGLPTVVDNDAKAFALGEGWLGAAAGVDSYIAMVVSTGVGGGIPPLARSRAGARPASTPPRARSDDVGHHRRLRRTEGEREIDAYRDRGPSTGTPLQGAAGTCR